MLRWLRERSDPASRVLRVADEEVLREEADWNQRAMTHREGDGRTSHCLAGALFEASRRCGSEILGELHAFLRVAQAIGGPDLPTTTILRFNDAPGRTFAEVKAVLAAARAVTP
jgi:hypothetical protein